MNLSYRQSFLLILIDITLKILWFFDAVTENIILYTQRVFVVAVFTLYLGFCAYSTSTKLSVFFFEELFGIPTRESTQLFGVSNVLGANSIKKDLPKLVNKIQFPEITANSVLVVDKMSSKVLYEKDSSKKLASASTTKLMTALVALDIYSLDEILSVSTECSEVESTKAELPVGTSYRVKDLITSMLIFSAGDSACVLANGKNNYDEFLYLMNQKAFKLGMQSTFFTNAIGLDGLDSSHFSSAQDLYKLASAAMVSDTIRAIVKTKEFNIKSTDDSYIGALTSTNKLLWEIPNTVGIKTGTTAEAGQVLIYEFSDELKDIVIIVMGSDDRFTDTRALLNWAIASYSWQ